MENVILSSLEILKNLEERKRLEVSSKANETRSIEY